MESSGTSLGTPAKGCGRLQVNKQLESALRRKFRSRFFLRYRFLLLLTLFYGHLLAEVASSLGVRSSVCCISGQIN